nr:reverse transcriptase domain-containing protein [Tanacetum cinerariifolium]
MNHFMRHGRYKDLLRACHHHGFTELHQLDTFYNALNPADQDSLNSAAGGNLLERRTQDGLMIIEIKSKGSPPVARKRTLAHGRYKDLLRACHHHGFTELHQLDTFYNALNPADQDSLNSAAGGNLLERRTQDGLMIIEIKSKVRNSQNKSVVSQVKSCDANSNNSSEIVKLTHAVNQQMSFVTTAITAILK